MLLLEERTILVTGFGAGGFGTAVVPEIVRQGGIPVLSYFPPLADRIPRVIERLVEEMDDPAGKEVLSHLHCFPCDLSSEDSVSQMRDQLYGAGIKLHGFLHSVANIPEELKQPEHTFLKTSTEGMIETILINAWSLQWMTKYLLGMDASGKRVLTTDSIGAAMTFTLGGEKYISSYIIGHAKRFLDGIASMAAMEAGRLGLRLHLVDAGPARTTASRQIEEFGALYDAVPDLTPLGINTTVEDVAQVICVTLSPYVKSFGLYVHCDHGLRDQGVVPVRDKRPEQS